MKLSRTPGGMPPTGGRSLEGRHWSVTTSLETALRYLRCKDRPGVMWVDALCINQADLEERAEQVQRMKQIYESAKAVVGWLGTVDDDAYTGMALIEKVATCIYIPGGEDPLSITPEYFRRRGLDITTANWGPTWSVLNRPYWERVWVIQELASCLEDFPRIGRILIPFPIGV